MRGDYKGEYELEVRSDLLNRRSYYQVGLYKGSALVMILGYVPTPTRANLLDLTRHHGGTIVAMLDGNPPMRFRAGAWTFGPFTIRKTGRTERDVLREDAAL
jgi:hypothetical protein